MTRDPLLNIKPSVAVSYDDIRGMTRILGKQQEHLEDLVSYVCQSCADTAGMTNLMALLIDPVQTVAGDCVDPLNRSGIGLGQTDADLGTALNLFEQTDYDSAVDLSGLFQTDVPGRLLYHEAQGLERGLLHGGYTEVWHDTPRPSHKDPGMDALIDKRRGDLSGRYEEYWAVLVYEGGQLLDQVIKPMVGDYTTLYAFQEAYQNLGVSTYQIAANLRRGTYAIAPKWQGYFAENFEFHMLCWHEGLGGLGDLYLLVSRVFKAIYGEVVVLVDKALGQIDELTAKFRRVDEVFDRNPGSWDYILRCNIGYAVANKLISEKDMKEALRRMQDAVEQVAKVVKTIKEVEEKYKGAKARFQQIWDGIGTVRKKGLDGAMLDLAKKQYNKYMVDFEAPGGTHSDDGWEPGYGVWRYAMLPI